METLSSQVLEFNGKAKAAQLDHLSDASILGKFLVFSANVRLDWKGIASANTLAYFDPISPKKTVLYDRHQVDGGFGVVDEERKPVFLQRRNIWTVKRCLYASDV
jgi:hypothetical protein